MSRALIRSHLIIVHATGWAEMISKANKISMQSLIYLREGIAALCRA